MLFRSREALRAQRAAGVPVALLMSEIATLHGAHYAGIDNLEDREPPFVYDGATNALTGGAYDFVGRFFWMRVQVKF